MTKEEFATMQNKAKKLTGFLALSLILVGCGEIKALPTNYEDKLIENATHDINNALKVIYDKYVETDASNEAILDEVLLSVAKAYAEEFDQDVIDARLKEKFFKDISSGSYDYRHVFNEEHYVIDKVYKNNYYIVDTNGAKVPVSQLGSYTFFNEGIFLPHIDETNFDNPAHKLVHIDYYKDYMKARFEDEVYRELLVEKYVKDEQAATIGRNYARKVTYVAISESSENPEAARQLVNAFVNEKILNEDRFKRNPDLNILANAWRGLKGDNGDFMPNAPELTLLNAAKLDPYKHTLYGELLTKFGKITDNEKTTDKAIENEFTNNGAYTKETGKEIKKNELRKKDFVVSEWAIKNGGLNDLPSSIRDRLFNIGVANGVDFVLDDRGVLANSGKVHADLGGSKNTFVRNIDGKYYLVPQTYEKGNNANFVFYENKTYYIIQIDEAVNTAKLTENNNRYYGKAGVINKVRSAEEIQEILDSVARELAEVASTSANARQYYIEKLDITFHDEDVKAFFVERFPDVFDEDK
jgi:hypothetical protein